MIRSWEALPDWFLQVTFWIVAAVLGVKKIGDYLPGAGARFEGCRRRSQMTTIERQDLARPAGSHRRTG